jgi:AcrR family transcriptional regulator
MDQAIQRGIEIADSSPDNPLPRLDLADGLGVANPARRTVRGVETVDRVVKAAVELLDEGGEQDFRVAVVSERTGVSVGSLYHHFGNRDGLIKAARAHEFLSSSFPSDGAAIAEIAASSSTAAEFLDRLTAIIRDVHSADRAPRRLRLIELIGSSVSRPDLFETVRHLQSDVMRQGEDVADIFLKKGWVKDGISARSLVSFILALGIGRVVIDLDEDPVDPEEWVRVVRFAMEGLLEL